MKIVSNLESYTQGPSGKSESRIKDILRHADSKKKNKSNSLFLSDLLEKMLQQNMYVSQDKGAVDVQQTGDKLKRDWE